MNWGKGIIIGLAAFMLFILGMGIRMLRDTADDHDDDYYEKGLKFNAEYQKQRQVTLDNAWPNIVISHDTVTVLFKRAATGEIHFMRPSDTRLDRIVKFTTGTDGRFVTRLPLPAGRWRLVFDWQSRNTNYLYQREIDIP